MDDSIKPKKGRSIGATLLHCIIDDTCIRNALRNALKDSYPIQAGTWLDATRRQH